MKALEARGWRYRWFDTARFVNLLLLLAGYKLADRPVGELHHIGELSSVDRGRSPGLGRRGLEIVRAGPSGRPLRRIADGVSHPAARQAPAARLAGDHEAAPRYRLPPSRRGARRNHRRGAVTAGSAHRLARGRPAGRRARRRPSRPNTRAASPGLVRSRAMSPDRWPRDDLQHHLHPGDGARLLPFALSFLQSPEASGSGWSQTAARRRRSSSCAPSAPARIASPTTYCPSIRWQDTDSALNQLFEHFPEPQFAFADSDVIASGDFMARLGTPAAGTGGALRRPEGVDDRRRAAGRRAGVDGRSRRQFLADGTYVGNSYCAVYDRSALEPAWRAAPLGFDGHYAHQIPRSLRRSLASHGWRPQWLDTGRLINLQLLAAGYELEERQVPELHHVGGLTYRHYRPTPGWSRAFREILHREPGRSRLRRIAEGISMRRHNRQQQRSLEDPPSPPPRCRLGLSRRGDRRHPRR